MKVRVPYQLSETDTALMIAINPDGQLVPGLVNRKDIPKLYPVDDLTRLTSCRAVVSSIESTMAKNSAIDDLKVNITALLSSYSIQDKDLVIRPSTQSELMQLRPKVANLRENEELFQRNKLDNTEFRSQIQQWFSQSFKACEAFVICLCTGKDDKLASMLTNLGVPKWFFEKVSSAKHTELSQATSFSFLFPKKLSKMITFTVSELENFEFIQNQSLMRDRISTCTRYLALHPESNKKAIVYPIPYDFSLCFREYSDLPKFNRTDSKVTLFSVAVIHSIFGAFEPKLITVENLKLHHDSLVVKKCNYLTDIEVCQTFMVENHATPLNQIKGIPELVLEHISSLTAKSKNLKLEETLNQCTLSDAMESLIELNKDLFSFKDQKLEPLPATRGDISIDPESNRNIKSQYLDIVREEQITAFRLDPKLSTVFGLTRAEHEILPPFISSLPERLYKVKESKRSPSILFSPQKVPEETLKAYQRKLESIKPIEPKARNRGNPNSTLGREGIRFVGMLVKAKAHPTFVENVRSYLTLFHSLSFQDQAVKIMEASLKLKEVINYYDEEEALESVAKEDLNSEEEENDLNGLL